MDEPLPQKDPPAIPQPKLPRVGVSVLVIHEERELMAYLDSRGNWRDAENGNVLPGHVKILNRGQP
jgi:hypothetical protein